MIYFSQTKACVPTICGLWYPMISNKLQINISEYVLQAADRINIWHKKSYCCEHTLCWNVTEQRTRMTETSNKTRRTHEISQSTVLDEFEKLLKAAIRFVMSVRLSVCSSVSLSGRNNLTPTRRILIKFYI